MSFRKSGHRQVSIEQKLAHPIRHVDNVKIGFGLYGWFFAPFFVVGVAHELGLAGPVVGPEPVVFMWLTTFFVGVAVWIMAVIATRA